MDMWEDSIKMEFRAIELGRDASPEFLWLKIGQVYGKAEVATDASCLFSARS